MARIKSMVVAILGFCLAFSPVMARAAVDSEDLLDILREEKVITVDQAEKMKQKLQKVEKEKQQDWKVYWKNGVNVESKDGKFKVNIGGFTQVDFGGLESSRTSLVDQLNAFAGGNAPLTGFGTQFRRARLSVEGTLFDICTFKSEFDFTDQQNGTVGVKDLWVGMRTIPIVNNIRVGHQKEPFSLEELTSDRWTTFMERALPNVFAPSRQTGIYTFNNLTKENRLWYGVGAYLNTNTTTGRVFTNSQNWDFTARMTGLPIYQDKGRKLLHLGFCYTHQFRNQGQFLLSYSQRPEFNITSVRPLNTANGNTPAINTNYVDEIDPEIALVWGPFSLQGEYIFSFVNAPNRNYNPRNTSENRNLFLKSGNPNFQGAYIQASFFLTGENRKYSLTNACFDQPIPNRNFDLAGGPGAWEVAFRYSYLNLNSRVSSNPLPAPPGGIAEVGVRGGIENNITVGVNWYLNPNFRWTFNYIYGDVDNLRVNPLLPNYRTNYNHGPLQIFQTRFQVSF